MNEKLSIEDVNDSRLEAYFLDLETMDTIPCPPPSLPPMETDDDDDIPW